MKYYVTGSVLITIGPIGSNIDYHRSHTVAMLCGQQRASWFLDCDIVLKLFHKSLAAEIGRLNNNLVTTFFLMHHTIISATHMSIFCTFTLLSERFICCCFFCHASVVLWQCRSPLQSTLKYHYKQQADCHKLLVLADIQCMVPREGILLTLVIQLTFSTMSRSNFSLIE